MFTSALSSVLGEQNPLRLPPRRHIVVVLVDGLGAQQLSERAGHAPFLSKQLDASAIVNCAYPPTTSANIGSFSTGLMPGEHGLIGHQVWDRHHDERLNLLVGWNERTDPLVWQPHQTIAELARAREVVANVIAAEEYRNTPYSVATMRGANFIAADTIADRFHKARIACAEQERSISYLYVAELDKFGHKHGWRSSGWAALLEEVDAQARRFAADLPRETGLILTSDHGMMETEKDRQLLLDIPLDRAGIQFFGGDTRSSYIYLTDPESADNALSELEEYSYALNAFRTQDLLAAGWFGNVGFEAKSRLPELVLQARNNFTLYHSKFSKQRAFDMVSHHGSASPGEMQIPLIRFGL